MSTKRKLTFSGALRSGGMKKKAKKPTILSLTSKPSSIGSPVKIFKLAGTPVLLTSVVTTGIINTSINIAPATAISGWSTRFQNTFDEWRLLSCAIEIIPLGIYTGVTAFFFSEEALASVTLSEATERSALFIKNNEQAPRNRVMRWTNNDFTDATYRAISSTFSPVELNVYTDNANLGSPTSATQLFIVRPLLTVQFRGLAST
jgi:hypothetical protein